MSKFIGYHLINKLLTIVLFGNAYDVDAKHPNYKAIVAGLNHPKNETQAEEEKRAKRLLKLVQADDADLRVVASKVGWEDVKVDHGVVTVKGKPLHNTLTKRIVELKNAGLPFDSFVRFLVNLQQNPSQESIDSLFDFLDQGKFGFTDDGCFLGYKGVKWGTLQGKRVLVDCHSESFDMSPGQSHSMPREKVDDNRGSACGAGFHIGTIDHARGFGEVMIVVKCHPKDVVSVPTHDTTKLRTCAYEVVHVFEDRQGKVLDAPEYAADGTVSKKAQVPAADLRALPRDKLVRMAADKGITRSVNEGRALGKNLLVVALTSGKLPLDKMTAEELAEFCVRRHLFASVKAARKAGAQKMRDAIKG